jgi:beta-galactosidase
MFPLVAQAAVHPSGRERVRLDTGWRFALGHATDPAKDFGHATGYFSYLAKTGYGDGPASPAFDDRGWREVNVPHDWAVEMPFDPNASHSHGYKAVGPRFPQNSVGWYRRGFTVPAEDLGRRIRIEFDGVYRAARVFINGFYVGEEPSGYLNFSYDLTDYLNYGGENVIAVRVDASMEEGWFYEGAGIYRHAWLVKSAPLHVEMDGVWVRAEVSGDSAAIAMETSLKNDGRVDLSFVLSHRILGPQGNLAGEIKDDPRNVPAGERLTAKTALTLKKPELWSLENPALHTLITTVLVNGQPIDEVTTRFGVRTIHFDPNAGFFLNGKHVVLKGTNNHQDHAGVGAAIPDALQEFRLKRLQEMGSNAYRASHNPPTPELLDACDRLGILVIDETRLMGSNPYHLTQLERLIRRDRNHPSIILWSIGNEEWAIESNIKGARITTTMQDFVKRVDPTRLSTVAISGGWGGSSTTIAVAGFNYIKQGDTDRQHAEFPEQIIVGTEETTTQATRGIYVDNRAACHLAPVEDGSSGGNAELGWQHYAARPYAAGVFYWTGFDYRGEATPFGFPAISTQFGILDTCGFPKDSFYYLKSWWTDEPVLHLFPHWNWPDRVGQPIEVRAHSNCEEVELFLNGATLGRKPMPKNGHLAWTVTYAPGVLLARGYTNGREVLRAEIETTTAPAAIQLTPDRTSIGADGRDVSVITVDVRDASGRIVPTANVPVSFSIRGPGRIIGVGNGDPSSHEPDVFVPSVRAHPIGAWRAPDAAPNPNPVTFEATFDRPAGGDASFELLLNALGKKQTVWLNGRALYTDAAPQQARTTIVVEAEHLRPTGNVIRFHAERYDDWGQRETLSQLQPAAFRIVTPPGEWRRSTFNGLAQIIVQSSGQPGEITLQATSPGLTSAELQVRAR